jgi:hypothetical protein
VTDLHLSWKLALAGLAALLGAQLVPIRRVNPPVELEVAAPSEVREVLRRACYDCHSHETQWPWYADVAPISWLVAYDVHEAREELNFSTWNRYDGEKQSKLRQEVWEEVEEGEMPLWYYLPFHPEAQLGERDLQLLREWGAGRS